MNLLGAVKATLRSRRFWVWQVGGAIIYGIPVAIRYATGNVNLPVLSLLETPAVDHYIPNNLVEKILINAFFPGGAGGVAGELLISNYNQEAAKGKAKYLSRLGGALLQTAVWSAFQLWGYSLMIIGPWSIGEGWGNIFEYWMVFPLNFLLASLSIFTPDVLSFVKTKIKQVSQKFKSDR